MTDDPIAIITGGGTGMGRCLAEKLARNGHRVWIVGRREEPLKATAEINPERIQYCVADLADPAGRQTLLTTIPTTETIDILVHHAATLEPVAFIRDLALDSWRTAFATNVEAPLFLTNALLGRLSKGSRVLFISSGLAEQPMAGRAAYAATKAALESICRSFNLECQDSGIGFNYALPGVVDTETLRIQVAKAYPSQVDRIDEFLKETLGHQLLQPKYVCQFLYWLLTGCEIQRFVNDTWDIREEAHHVEWQVH